MEQFRRSDLRSLRADFSNLIAFIPEQARTAAGTSSQTADLRCTTASSSGSEIRGFYENVTSRNGASPSRECQDGVSTRSMAAQKTRRKTESQVQSGGMVDHRQKMEFLRCVEQGEGERVREFLQKGMPVDCSDHFGWTALMCASFAGQGEVVEALLSAGADAQRQDARGRTAAGLAAKRGHRHILELLRRDLSSPADSPSETKDTPVIEPFFCADCKTTVVEDKMSHLTSVIHLLHQKRVTKSREYFLRTSNKGYQLMVKHGWDEEKGLGAEGQGRKFPVKTVLKRDRKGIGCQHKDKPRVTHFTRGDAAAVESVYFKSSTRKMTVRTLSKRAQQAKERRDRAWEIRLRQYMNSE